jgi:hypothetical protein
LNAFAIRAALLATLASLSLSACNRSADTPAETATAAADSADQGVKLGAEGAATNGIVVAPVQPASALNETVTIGNAIVVDITDLVSGAAQYEASRAQEQQASVHALASHAALDRARLLNADNKNISDRVVQESAAAAASDDSAVHAATASLTAARAALRQKWGSVVADGVLGGAQWGRRLVARQAALIETSFNEGTVPPPMITITAASGRPAVARYVGASPRVDARLQRATHFYVSNDATDLPIGLATVIRQSLTGENGVVVPSSAVVWYSGAALVFVESSAGTYVERPVGTTEPVAQGFLVTTIQPGERVVVSGAQQLLSERHKPEAE